MDIGGVVGNLKLSIEFAKRDLKERYIGTSFGQLWLIINHPITLDFLFLIPLMFLVTLFGLGIGVILSLFNPFFRDLKEIVPIVLQLWFWMTPIIYIKDLLLKKYPILIDINPIYYFIDNFQQIFLYGKIDSFNSFIVSIFLAILSILLSGYFYKKMISAIKDII